ncbi:ATP-binding protein [Streptomyces sviceus]|uniref:hypothetical protein n=1 Tax=Streptomyces sviceus TaxID=285530 RepID=UPI0036E31629
MPWDVVVWDSDPAEPAARAADPGRIGQHGLEIVKAVTEDLFIEQEPVGKRITARIPLAGIPSDTAARRQTSHPGSHPARAQIRAGVRLHLP